MINTDGLDFLYRTQIKLLGGVIEVRCKYEDCLKGIVDFFSTLIISKFEVPDIIIFCNWKNSGRYLYRTSPSENNNRPVEGVFYQLPGENQIKKWDSYDPPLPPFVKEPFVNHFVALHAAAIKDTHNNAFLFIGPKGSGKTTSALQLVNNLDLYELLTDETVFLRTRSLIIEPFPRLVLPRIEKNDEIIKYSINAKDAFKKIAQKPAIIAHGFFLKQDYHNHGIAKISSEQTYRKIVEHYQYGGSNFKESMITLSNLSKEVSFSQITYNNFEQLLSLLKSVPDYLSIQSEKITS